MTQPTSSEEFSAELHRLMRLRKSENSACLTLYKAFRRAKPTRPPLVKYQCSNRGDRCLLLAVHPAPTGPFIYSPAYHYSPEEMARQDLSGLRSGLPERAYFLDELLDLPGVMFGHVACDHLIALVNPDVIAADLDRSPVRRFLPDGEADVQVLSPSARRKGEVGNKR